MSRKSSLARSTRYKRCSCQHNCTNKLSAIRRCNESDSGSSLTITDFQIKITDDEGISKSSRKTVRSTSSEISEPGSSSTIFRQRSRESLHSDAAPPPPPSVDQAVNNSECIDIDTCDLPIILEETRRTSCAQSSPLSQLDSDSRCSVQDSVDEFRSRCRSRVNASDIIFDIRDRSLPLTATKIITKQVKNVAEKKPSPTGEASTRRATSRDEDEIADDHRLTKSTVAEPKYKLTDKAKRRITLTNPILSGHVIDHYFRYGKPPFKNFGGKRDLKTRRF